MLLDNRWMGMLRNIFDYKSITFDPNYILQHKLLIKILYIDHSKFLFMKQLECWSEPKLNVCYKNFSVTAIILRIEYKHKRYFIMNYFARLIQTLLHT